MGEPWEDEGNISGVPLRILTVDVQRGFFYVVVRSWAMNGSSRLMHCAHVLTWNDIINIQMQFGVHANLCFIDCEAMSVCAAIMLKFVGGESVIETAEGEQNQ